MKIYINNSIAWRRSYPILPPKAELPCLVLVHDNWDDFDYKTHYLASIFDENGKLIFNGNIKIGKKNEKETNLEPELSRLPKGYYSLWQDVSNYHALSKISFHESILRALNDICYNKVARRDSEKLDITYTSFRRFSEAEKAYQEGPSILDNSNITSEYSFEFLGDIGKIKFPKIYFDLSKKKYNLKRICAIIGKNGVGKTTLLANIASALSGINIFQSTIRKRPPFSKVIAISYSAFDEFHRPKKSERTFSYSYCGVRGAKEFLLSQNQMKEKFQLSYSRIAENGLLSFWETLIEDLLDVKITDIFAPEKNVISSFEELSSGQKFMVLSFSQILSTIKENSLLLFDEPETHLHPNGQSSLLKSLQRILERFDSYSIIATHSPVFLQGVLKENAIHLQKIANGRIANNLKLETFEQHFSILTEEIFTFNEDNHYFFERIKELVRINGSNNESLNTILNEINSDGVKYTLETIKYEKFNDTQQI